MATTKITITLPNDQIEQIRSLVTAGEAASVSAFVKQAAGVALSGAGLAIDAARRAPADR